MKQSLFGKWLILGLGQGKYTAILDTTVVSINRNLHAQQKGLSQDLRTFQCLRYVLDCWRT